jgi:hypothetical protein
VSRDKVFRAKLPGGTDSGWIAFPYAANYQAFNASFSTPGYRKVGDIVYLRGAITRNTSTAAANSTCGTLPAGFRPPLINIFEQHLGPGRCRVDVLASGAINHADVALTVGGFLVLDGVFFSVLP